MGKTFSTGFLTDCVFTDSSNNVGIGGAPSGNYKFEVTGTTSLSSYLLGTFAEFNGDGTNAGSIYLKQRAAASGASSGYSAITAFGGTTFLFGLNNGTTNRQFQFSANLLGSTLRAYSLPNADGTLALTSDLGAYLPLSGGTLTGSLGIGISPSLPLYVKQVATDGYAFGIESSADDTKLVIGKRAAGFAISATYGSTGSYQSLSLYTSDSPRLTIATNGAATFSSSVTAVSTAYGAVGGFIINYTGISSSRSWRLANDQAAFGDFAIQQSISQTSSTYTSRLYIHPDGGVGINTTNPSSTSVLTLQESGTLSGALSMLNRNGNQRWLLAVDAYAVDDKYLAFIDASNNAVRMVIGDNGNVGISTSPSYKLDIRNDVAASTSLDPVSIGLYNGNDGGSAIYFRNSVGGQSKISFGVEGTGSGTDDTYLGFSTGGNTSLSERMRITSGGNVGIGTSSAGVKLQVNDAQTGGGTGVADFFNTSSADAAPGITITKASATTSSSARFIQFYANSQATAMGGIVGNGASNVQFASLSDIREKENIKSINGSLSKILALNPVEFDWIKSKEHTKAGFIAQEVEKIFPEYVIENIANDGEEERKGLTGGMTSGIIAVLVKAIQELKAEIDELKNK